jgi:hypothetical protein
MAVLAVDARGVRIDGDAILERRWRPLRIRRPAFGVVPRLVHRSALLVGGCTRNDVPRNAAVRQPIDRISHQGRGDDIGSGAAAPSDPRRVPRSGFAVERGG